MFACRHLRKREVSLRPFPDTLPLANTALPVQNHHPLVNDTARGVAARTGERDPKHRSTSENAPLIWVCITSFISQ